MSNSGRLDQRVQQRLNSSLGGGREKKSTAKEMSDPREGVVTDLYERYGEILGFAVSGFIKDEAQVEDVVQGVFLQLYREAVRETFDRRRQLTVGVPLGDPRGQHYSGMRRE